MTDRGYGRISLDTARSGSIQKQRESVARKAGDDFVWYADESVSGAKVPFGQRPAGAQLLADLRAGDRVLVTKIDRAARSVTALLELVEHIKERKATIVFTEQDVATEGAFGAFFLTLLGAVAELEAAIVAERRLESLEAFKAEGRHAVGKAPLGFMSVERTDGRGLVIRPDPETAPLVKDAIKRVLDGEPQESVRHSLGMSKTGFHSLLHNPRLAGMTPENRYETYRDPESKRQKTRQVGSGVVTLNGAPLIDPESAILSMSEWRALERHLKKPEKKWSRQDGYGAALSCVVCGERMYKQVSKVVNGATGKTHDTYKCRRVKHAKGQGAPTVMVHKADAHLETTFLDMFGSRRVLTRTWSDSADARLEAVSLAQVHLSEAQRRFAVAVTEADESDAMAAMQEAKSAVRAAEALPSKRVSAFGDSGQTVAELWATSTHSERVRLLTVGGRWVLHSGRESVDKRIRWEPDELLIELITRRVGGDSAEFEDANTYIYV